MADTAGIMVRSASKEEIREAREAVLAILATAHEEKTIRLALEQFSRVVSVSNVTIHDCSVIMPPKAGAE